VGKKTKIKYVMCYKVLSAKEKKIKPGRGIRT
jgi:hypothetical protein